MSSDTLRLFQEENKDLQVLFVDEYSLVDLKLLGMMEHRCREAKDNSNVFGDLCVVMLGDVNQLGPLFDNASHSTDIVSGTTSFAQRGKLTLSLFEKSFILNIPMRFNDTAYVKFLGRVSCGSCTKADIA